MEPLKLYAIFHFNLNYSSIEDRDRRTVVERCYWPLLRLAADHQLPLGFELSGYTLEAIQQVDSSLHAELRRLVTEGNCELVGSGYSQIIGPLVPAQVNAPNLRIGQTVYEAMLGTTPEVAFISEQAYSGSLIPLYVQAGYKAVVEEWDNPFAAHPEWSSEWGYLPQYACSPEGEEIPLLWNNSISFQKFQRHAFGEMELDEYLVYLQGQVGDGPRAFPLYGSDTEVFDFRPGRYRWEPKIREKEWERIAGLFESIKQDKRFELCRPSEVLNLMTAAGAGNRLRLESSSQPIPVKKQQKYNITRWATTGKDDLGINTMCWRIYEHLKSAPASSEANWKELCYLWSSDFRTHITDQRWKTYQTRLGNLGSAVVNGLESSHGEDGKGDGSYSNTPQAQPEFCTRRQGRFLSIETKELMVRLDCHRGLAISGIRFKSLSPQALFGTLPHGYYPDISLGADYYTGHVIFQSPGQPQITDLNPVEPVVDTNQEWAIISASTSTDFGQVHKQIWISLSAPTIELRYNLDWQHIPVGCLRLGHITFNPEAFHKSSLFLSHLQRGIRAGKFFPGRLASVAWGARVVIRIGRSGPGHDGRSSGDRGCLNGGESGGGQNRLGSAGNDPLPRGWRPILLPAGAIGSRNGRNGAARHPGQRPGAS